MKKKSMAGSYTVEASFVISLICMIMIAFVVLTMYLHDKIIAFSILDRCLYEGEVYTVCEISAEDGTVQYEENADRIIFYSLLKMDEEGEVLTSRLQELLDDTYFFTMDPEEAKVTFTPVSVEASLRPARRFTLFQEILPQEDLWKRTAAIVRPAETVRALTQEEEETAEAEESASGLADVLEQKGSREYAALMEKENEGSTD